MHAKSIFGRTIVLDDLGIIKTLVKANLVIDVSLISFYEACSESNYRFENTTSKQADRSVAAAVL